MGTNSLPKTVTRQRRGCDLNPGPSAPESSTLTTRLPSHHMLDLLEIDEDKESGAEKDGGHDAAVEVDVAQQDRARHSLVRPRVLTNTHELSSPIF